MNSRRRLLHRVALASTIVWTGTIACHRWVPLETSPPPASEITAADQLRVHLRDGREIILRAGTHISGDSLIGYRTPRSADDPGPWGRTAIALDDIASIDERRADTPATVAVATGGVILGLLVIRLVACGGDACWGIGSD